MDLSEVLGAYEALGNTDRDALRELVQEAGLGSQKFVPSPGPQTDAWFSPADVLLYGGSGGGGKSALLVGLAMCEHRRSLLMRRQYTDLGAMVEDAIRFNGTREGFNGSPPPKLRTNDGRLITFGAAAKLGDEHHWQGQPHDLLGIDEAAQWLEAQVRFLMGWVRSTDPGQRTRVILASNPPLSADGDWMIAMFRPWLDLTHQNPAKPGELRWFVTDPDGKDMEVPGPEPIELDGRLLKPMSRSFIPAKLSDNPFLAGTDYDAKLDALPEPLRGAVRDGNFMAARQDDQWQVIPTQWIREAQARWTPEPPEHAPMSSIGVDVAQGGADQTVLSPRYDGWFAPLDCYPGSQTPTGAEVAGLVVAKRRNNAVIVVDLGGGWGGEAYGRLKENRIECKGHRGADPSNARTEDNTLKFFNKRAKVWWRLREALDPGQDGGSPIALPDDPELTADLTSCRFTVGPRGIKIESKDEVVKRLGRSPDKGDAVTLAWDGGPRLKTHGNVWRKALRSGANLKIDNGRLSLKRRR